MTFESFIENSKAIFEQFPNEQVWFQGGLVPNRQLQTPEAGYCVAIRYDEITTHAISAFMRKAYAILPPTVEYNIQSFHSTIGVFAKGDLSEFLPDITILESLRKSVASALIKAPGNPRVQFGKWLFNAEAILVSGFPNHDLWNLSQAIGTACQENRVPLEQGRIIHITTARFISAVSGRVFNQFTRLMETAPVLKPAKPSAIAVATWRCDGLTFEITPHEQFPL